MKTLVILTIALLLLSFSFISAFPEDMTGDEYKEAIIKANSPSGIFGFFSGIAQAVVGEGSYWGLCGQYCSSLPFGDCDACASNEIESSCFWSPDSYTAISPWSSAESYCNDWTKPEPDYNKQCYCSVPQQECSGGGSPGDKKCSNEDIYECSDSGVWEYYRGCEYTCENSQCVGECNRDSDCGDDRYIGSKYCKNDDVYQKYRTYDCSNYFCDYDESENLIEDCSNSFKCVGGSCELQCEPKTCYELSKWCGIFDDGCGGELNCGTCSDGKICNDGICTLEECVIDCSGKECGSDGCDSTCGTCSDEELCKEGICEEIGECTLNKDCKTLAEVVCDDESLFYHTYTCSDGECVITEKTIPESCKSSKENYLFQISIAVIIIFVLSLMTFGIIKMKKKKK